jgi:hypothetical protein
MEKKRYKYFFITLYKNYYRDDYKEEFLKTFGIKKYKKLLNVKVKIHKWKWS